MSAPAPKTAPKPAPEPGAIHPAPIMELIDLRKTYAPKIDMVGRLSRRLRGKPASEEVKAVDGVNLRIQPGELVGLVGESGCGKSTLGRVMAGIHEPTSGEVVWRGRNMRNMQPHERRAARRKAQMVFQDPFASLNPRMTVRDLVGQAPRVHGTVPAAEIDDHVRGLMETVGLPPAYADRYPHQFSGGQRQRIGIARALAVNPEFVVCDEPVAALDVSIQAQVINLFMDLRERLKLTYLFISHDIGVIEHLSDRIVIMYLGRVIESAPTEALFAGANHPYTVNLLEGAPRLDRRKVAYTPISGELPSPLNPPRGCHFHPRCPFATARCKAEAPALREVAPGHMSACHLNDG
ncbi:MAG: oligopeptide/dipeptide ABC transporter ATP-binding protein [Pseudomonadota bacterium]|nr:oligopeptide/dipeptide ABC transporter ATP-binding protein [Pseudomonadota bacterium]